MWLPLLAWSLALVAHKVSAGPVSQAVLKGSLLSAPDRNISVDLFEDLEELSRIVDISYCVGTTGIQKPFQCASRCQDFDGFELVTTWETGPLLSDSCGYLVVDHAPSHPRIILAFRGTYSLANAIVDLSTIPQEYVPYPGEEDGRPGNGGLAEIIQNPRRILSRDTESETSECTNCTVHAGFMTSWRHTRLHVIPHLTELIALYPHYQLTLVGHSLGGAVAALAALEFRSRGWKPQVTTFGEPRVGNSHMVDFIDRAFPNHTTYRRVTHVDDPVPLLPLTEWGYRMHGGEIYISKPDLPPEVSDLEHCSGDADLACIARGDSTHKSLLNDSELNLELQSLKSWLETSKDFLTIPSRLRIWQLFFAHRDYFWRLGLCLPYTGWDHEGEQGS